MAASKIVQMRSKGSLTVPIELRRKYGLDEGDVFTLIELGDGAFLLTPRRSEVEVLADQLAAEWKSRGETLETMLQALREEREKYGR